MIERMMSAMGLNAMVSAYVSGHDVPRHKPEPDVYFACMQALGVLPTECIVVEDSPTGIAAGKASGAQVVALSQYVVPGTDQTSADRIIERLSELSDIVQGR